MSVLEAISSSATEVEKFNRIKLISKALSHEELVNEVCTLSEAGLPDLDTDLWNCALSLCIIENKLESNELDSVGSLLSDVGTVINKHQGLTQDMPHLFKIVKFKHVDLNSDYQILFNVISKNYKLVELVNKKIVLLTIKDYSGIDKSFKEELVSKTIDLLIVSPYDFRKVDLVKFISSYVNEHGLDVKLSPLTEELFLMLTTNNIVNIEKFRKYTEQAPTKVIQHLDARQISANLVENSLFVLSNFYKSIYFSKLSKLLGVEVDHIVISKMIVNNNLPLNTKIDQVNEVLTFPDSTTNTFVETLNMVQHISNKLSI
ncbi:hypothetical protein PSN45_003450 [Yamadazyma tenuis]|uniref:PCI domain-containing protein n=1 Tax=Candida tenuis (strain ATCC 10573 / BCRC 21748 / CBS 615 / JCM 9827 / NBRC 10315 / NRRL Y-1498 / VKM Y-70) TaxID=590646 RepID=G3AY34_CANTC|nr:uncharacterized protein CANTEDRAFT_112621 [Yamadazyma tenuis ATCC 10573]EGV65760.1 hypothetical protein CANTEDRAFT_112621 [Yamadazyma tenuis ATCC 10573]WEJ95919.1 hypothetical protein PSN45_003450 [Yamadazyma tenuis]